MTCRTAVIHHAYHDENGTLPCCGLQFVDLLGSGEAETTDSARVTCSGGAR